ncbi:hypothetical protein CEP54_016193, partial [Fusarium duplospermum]
RTTSSHLHVVSARNSQKQFDCLWVPRGIQRRDNPPLYDAPKTEPLNLTKHQTLQPQYGRGTTSTRPQVNTDLEHINR